MRALLAGDLFAFFFNVAIHHALLPELLPSTVDRSGMNGPQFGVSAKEALQVLEAARYPIAVKYLAMKAGQHKRCSCTYQSRVVLELATPLSPYCFKAEA